MKFSFFPKFVGAVVTFCAALAFNPVQAATLTVSNLNDNGAGSLRSQIEVANASTEADTLVFDAGLQGIVTLTSPLNITSTLTVRGPFERPIQISGGNSTRLFTIASGAQLKLIYLTLADGSVTGQSGTKGQDGTLVERAGISGSPGGVGEAGVGGAIYNQGTLKIWNCLLRDNRAIGGQGGAGGKGGNALTAGYGGVGGTGGSGGEAKGGAVYNAGTASATFVNTTFANNQLFGGAGGVGGAGGSGPSGPNSSGASGPSGYGTQGSAIGCDPKTTLLTITHCTFGENKGDYKAAILPPVDPDYFPNDPSYKLTNSLLCGEAALTSGVRIGSNGNSLDAGREIGPLSDNGGPTQTFPVVATKYSYWVLSPGKSEFVPADEADLDNDGDTAEFLPFDARGPGFPRRVVGWVNAGALQYPTHYVFSAALPASVRVDSKVGPTLDGSGDGTTVNDTFTRIFVWKIGDEVVKTIIGATSYYDPTIDLSRYTQDVMGATLTCQVTWVSNQTGLSYTHSASTILNEAGSLTVTSNSDTSNGLDGLTTLREALAFLATDYGGTSPVIQFDLGSQQRTIQLTSALNVGSYYAGGTASSLLILASPPVTLLGKSQSDANGNLTAASDSFVLLRNSATLSLEGLNFKYGRGTFSSLGGGGAISSVGSLTVRGCRFEGNSSPYYGGAIGISTNSPFATTGPVALIEKSIFTNNSAQSGGAIYVGAYYTFPGPASPTVSLSGCTFDRNRGETSGGAIRFQGASLTASNCTFFGNSSTGDAQAWGGAVYANGPQSFVNCTFAGNKTSTAGGAIAQTNAALTLLNNLFADNYAGASSQLSQVMLGTSQTVPATLTDLGFNFVQVETQDSPLPAPFTATSNILGTNARLGALQDNGGLVPTMLLQGGSPALNAGADTSATPYSLANDARGTVFPRKYGTAVDIGALEVQTAPPAITGLTLEPTTPKTNDIVNARFQANDADGDNLTYSYIWKKNGGVIANETTSSLDLRGVGNGDHGDQISCIVTVKDAGEGIATAEAPSVTIANSAPVLEDKSFSFRQGQSVSSAQLTATDADSDTLTYSTTDTLPAGLTFNSDGSFSGTPTTVVNGLNITVAVSDGHGGSDTATITLTVLDITKPTVSIVTPFTGQKLLLSGFKFGSLTGTASDNEGIVSVEAKITRLRSGVTQIWNGSAFTTASARIPTTLAGIGSNLTWSLNNQFPPASELDAGEYIVLVYAADAAGNTASATTRFTLSAADTEAPVAQVFTPTLNQKVLISSFASGAITGGVTDNIGVSTVRVKLSRKRGTNYYWNGSAFTTTQALLNATVSPIGSTSVKWNLNNQMPSADQLDSGLYQLEVYGVDVAGNKSTTVVRPFTLGTDFTAPSVAITAPTASQKIALSAFGAGTINGTASDNLGVTSVKVKLQRKRGTLTTYWNGSEFTTTSATVEATLSTLGGTSIDWSLDTNVPTIAMGLDAGAYTVYATSYDAAGNLKTTASRTFTVTNTVSTPSINTVAASAGNS